MHRKSCFLMWLFTFALVAAGQAQTAGDSREEVPGTPRFVVYASEENSESAASLFRVLRDKNRTERILKADSLEKAAASPAGVLVLYLPSNSKLDFEPATIELLKKKKIVGIGTEAARLFGKMGLEINLGACAHSSKGPPDIQLTSSVLLGKPTSAVRMQVLNDTPDRNVDERSIDDFAMFLPARGKDAGVVDALARWADDPNYAPIVRQGNFILIGTSSPASHWSESFAKLIANTCRALHVRKLESFAKPTRDLQKPGIIEFKLAKSGSVEESFEKIVYFRPTTPVKITAQLQHSGSESVMMLFMGEDERRLHWTRRDAKLEEPLEIPIELTQQDLKDLGDGYWSLKVTNFGVNAEAKCKLTIKIDPLEASSEATRRSAD